MLYALLILNLLQLKRNRRYIFIDSLATTVKEGNHVVDYILPIGGFYSFWYALWAYIIYAIVSVINKEQDLHFE